MNHRQQYISTTGTLIALPDDNNTEKPFDISAPLLLNGANQDVLAINPFVTEVGTAYCNAFFSDEKTNP